MKEYLKKKTIIWGSILIAVCFVGFLIGIDLNSKESKIRGISRIIKNEAGAQGIIPYFMPRFPQRLMFLSSAVNATSQELVYLNEDLDNLTDQCDCENAKSQCVQNKITGTGTGCQAVGPNKTFGDPCLTRPDIEKTRRTIKQRTEYLSYLQRLLQKETEGGSLQRELDTLRPEVAAELEANLTGPHGLLVLNQEISAHAEENRNKPLECLANRCTADCGQGSSFGASLCLTAGEQKPMEIIFEAGVSLSDLKLDPIKIKNINLGLPDKIELPPIHNLPSFDISLPSLTFTFPEIEVGAGTLDLSQRAVSFNPPSPSLPEIPQLKLSCPDFSGSPPPAYDCGVGSGNATTTYQEFEWHLKTFSWLSGKCLEVIQTNLLDLDTQAKKDAYKLLMEKCMTPEKVAQRIYDECEDKWKKNPIFGYWYLPSGSPEICEQIGRSPDKINKAIEWCKDLFLNQITPSETPPLACSSAPKATIKDKCDDIRNAGIIEVPPLSCNLWSLFPPPPIELEGLTGETLPLPGIDCPEGQKVADYPSGAPGCPFSLPTIPKIPLSKFSVIIPDIILPDFNFCPFFSVDLPDFIFEDLILPDLEICNLDACQDIQNVFPDLRFKFPALTIPPIETLAIPLGELNLNISGIPVSFPLPKVELGEVEYPTIPFNFPQLFNLGDFVSPELEIPKIKLPQPQFKIGFRGLNLNINLLDLLLGLFQFPTGCLTAGIEWDCLEINLSGYGYHFSWPAFPTIPEIPFCGDIQNFCGEMKGKLGEVSAKITEIQDKVNTLITDNIQGPLNTAGGLINQNLTTFIQDQLNERAQTIKDEIEEHIQNNAQIVNGILKIPPFVIETASIHIDSIPITGIPDHVDIVWPPSLQKIMLTNEIEYKFPPPYDRIPLSRLSYEEEIRIKIPGLQGAPSVSLSALENYPSCESKNPKNPPSGNPCPVSDIQTNLQTIRNLNDEIGTTSKKIITILE